MPGVSIQLGRLSAGLAGLVKEPADFLELLEGHNSRRLSHLMDTVYLNAPFCSWRALEAEQVTALNSPHGRLRPSFAAPAPQDSHQLCEGSRFRWRLCQLV